MDVALIILPFIKGFRDDCSSLFDKEQKVFFGLY